MNAARRLAGAACAPDALQQGRESDRSLLRRSRRPSPAAALQKYLSTARRSRRVVRSLPRTWRVSKSPGPTVLPVALTRAA